jgi:K+-transporting ATPase ATPase C chain
MLNELKIAALMTVVTFVLTGLVYPLALTGLAQVLFRGKANGSLVSAEGRVVGSELIGQSFTQAKYFQGRPSAAGEKGYDASASSASNLGPTSQKLRDRVVADVERLEAENPDAKDPIPDELVTASGSGLDPHLSPQTVLWQVPRVAAARGVAPADLQALVAAHVENRTFGFLGESRVNVLLLNLDLDRRFGRPSAN